MPSAISQTNLKQQNFNNTTNPKLHFTPLIPKSSINKKNNSGSPHLVIKTSKRWILPPRPRPGKRNTPANNNNNNATITTTTAAASTTKSNNNNSNNLHTTNINKKPKTISSSKKQEQDKLNNERTSKKIINTVNETSSRKTRNELNYLAFLNFEENDETDRSTSNGSGQTLIHDSNLPTTRITNKNLPLMMTGNKDISHSPLDLSSSTTMVSTPNSTNINEQQQLHFNRRFSAPIKSSADKIERVDENAYFQKVYDEMDLMQDVNTDLELFSDNSSGNTFSPGSMNKEMSATTDDTNLTLDNEDELYNTIWEFLPRYTGNNDNNNKSKIDITANKNSTTDKTNSNYLYVAPSLEELMDEQDNFMNLFEDTTNNTSFQQNNNQNFQSCTSSTFNVINDFTSNNMKNFINANDFEDDEDFDILKTESL